MAEKETTQAVVSSYVPVAEEVEIAAAVSSFWAVCTMNSACFRADTGKALTLFHSSALPPITLLQYVIGIMGRCSSGSEIVKAGLIIVSRYCKAVRMLPSKLSAHRLILVGMLIANKLHHDRPRRNKDYSYAGGVTVSEICALEARMCRKTDFRLTATPVEYAAVEDPTSDNFFTLLFPAPSTQVNTEDGVARSVAIQTEASYIPVDAVTQTVAAAYDDDQAAVKGAPSTLVTFLGVPAGHDQAGVSVWRRGDMSDPPSFALPPQCVVDCGNQTMSRNDSNDSNPVSPGARNDSSIMPLSEMSSDSSRNLNQSKKFAALRQLSASTSPVGPVGSASPSPQRPRVVSSPVAVRPVH